MNPQEFNPANSRCLLRCYNALAEHIRHWNPADSRHFWCCYNLHDFWENPERPAESRYFKCCYNAFLFDRVSTLLPANSRYFNACYNVVFITPRQSEYFKELSNTKIVIFIQILVFLVAFFDSWHGRSGWNQPLV